MTYNFEADNGVLIITDVSYQANKGTADTTRIKTLKHTYVLNEFLTALRSCATEHF